TRAKLHGLFGMIEKEFEHLYLENLNLQEKLELITERYERESLCTDRALGADDIDGLSTYRSTGSTHKVFGSGGRLKSHTNKLKYQTNKIMSGLKAVPPMTAAPVKRYLGHKDGVWDVCVAKQRNPLVATASADHTAKVWGMHSGNCLLNYQGHQGSVNSISVIKQLTLSMVFIAQYAEYEDSLLGSVLRTPLMVLQGHSGVVISGDWFPGGDQVVTGGWDRQACVWDSSTGELLNQLVGHDEDLTHTTTHPTQRLVVTASKDSTFRLWDFRETIHSVMVFQAHQDSVTSAVFVPNTDFIVSGSDDRSTKVWDLRNMRAAVTSIQSDSAVNRISVNNVGLIAVPYDNRNIRIFDLTGNRLARLPRSSRQGHSRMACCTAWAEDLNQRPNLFSVGFDRQVIGWSIQQKELQEEKEGFRLSLSLKGKDISSLKEHLLTSLKEHLLKE
ncbi:WD repeat-containing protein 37, partial [Eurytemora carolleeae]|uniref:WD repeat-containing protein 37 n=1 Tax=Eurytemora carolleeae TaxID=1294199 RepID=UPI000C7583D1